MTTDTETTAGLLASVLNNVTGSWARQQQKILQVIVQSGIEGWGSEGVGSVSFGQSQQMGDGEGKIGVISSVSNTH